MVFGVVGVTDIVRRDRLRWFGHLEQLHWVSDYRNFEMCEAKNKGRRPLRHPPTPLSAQVSARSGAQRSRGGGGRAAGRRALERLQRRALAVFHITGRRALERLQRRALAVFHITVRHETTPSYKSLSSCYECRSNQTNKQTPLYTGIRNDFRVERVVKRSPPYTIPIPHLFIIYLMSVEC